MAETPLLTESPAGFFVCYRARQLYPAPPEPAAAAKALALPLYPNTLYILASPLLWYGVTELVGRLPPGSRLAIMELDSALFQLIDWEQKWKELGAPAMVKLIPPSNLDSMASSLIDCIDRQVKKVVSIGLNGGRLLNQAAYQTLTRHCEEELRRFWRNQTTLMYMGRLWNRNLISNLIGGGEVKDISTHSRHPHVVVAGAGPSLDHAIAAIQSRRLQIFLVAVDTALPTMYRHGLAPDLIVAVEAQLANLKDFIPAGLRLPEVACDLSSTPLVFRHFECRSTWCFVSQFAPGSQWASLDSRSLLPARIPALGSVGVVALYLCRFIAAERISIIGLDFAWHAGATHSQDSPSRLATLHTGNRLQGNGGETASLKNDLLRDSAYPDLVSDKILRSYRDSLNEVIALLEQEGLRVFDARSQGLPLNAPKAELEGLLDSAPHSESPAPIAARRADEPTGRPMKTGLSRQQAAREWLSGTLTMIDDCIARIDRQLRPEMAQDPQAGAPETKELLDCLAGLDWLFHELPDRDWPNLNPGALIRARVILDYFREFILQRS